MYIEMMVSSFPSEMFMMPLTTITLNISNFMHGDLIQPFIAVDTLFYKKCLDLLYKKSDNSQKLIFFNKNTYDAKFLV